MAETAGVKIGGKKYSYKTLAVVVGALLGAFVLLRNQGTSQAGYSSAEGTNQRITGVEEGVTKLIDDLYKYIDGMFQGQPVAPPISTTPSYWDTGGGPSVGDWGLDVVAAQNFSSVGNAPSGSLGSSVKSVSFGHDVKVKQDSITTLATPVASNVKSPSGQIVSTPAQQTGVSGGSAGASSKSSGLTGAATVSIAPTAPKASTSGAGVKTKSPTPTSGGAKSTAKAKAA